MGTEGDCAADRDGYVIGVDGGTTKTVALVAARSGEVIGAARGPGSNIYAPPDAETALDAAEWTVRRAVESAGVDAKEVGVAAYSMSGADWPEDFEYISHEFATRGLVAR
ncbi:MAG: BadF/BadG/BcrA/BcrD ATPase family protein [Chloroflexia bacterium]